MCKTAVYTRVKESDTCKPAKIIINYYYLSSTSPMSTHGRHNMPLQVFDMSTSKWGHGSPVSWASSFLPIFSLLRSSILHLVAGMEQTDRRTDTRPGWYLRQKPLGEVRQVVSPPFPFPFPSLPPFHSPKFSDKPVGGKVRSSEGKVPRLPPPTNTIYTRRPSTLYAPPYGGGGLLSGGLA